MSFEVPKNLSHYEKPSDQQETPEWMEEFNAYTQELEEKMNNRYQHYLDQIDHPGLVNHAHTYNQEYKKEFLYFVQQCRVRLQHKANDIYDAHKVKVSIFS